ncbi:TPA: hypothetical protein I7775_20370 [Vibrio vulnificus]|nr:hypothetical protein [Vibrio vulnificus]
MLYQKNTKNRSEMFFLVLLAIIAFILNEYIYYYKSVSFFVNVFILFIGLHLFISRSHLIFTYLPYIGFLINSRPREIHLIAIEMRGAFEYYSINIQKLFFFSFSTTLIIVLCVIMFLKAILQNEIKLKLWSRFIIVIFISFIGTLFFALKTNTVYLAEATNSLRYIVFLLGGVLLFQYYKVNDITRDEIEKSILRVLIIAVLLSIMYFIKDAVTADFKLRYVTSSIFFIASLFYIALNNKVSNVVKLLIPVVGVIVFFPITRGEQLNLMLCFFIYFLLSFSQVHNKSYKDFFMSKIIVVCFVMAFILGALYIYNYLPETWNMIMMKFEFFTSSDLNHDQSSSVRSSEFAQILYISNFWDFIEILIGKGLYGYYSFEHTFTSYLNESDFSLYEIQNNIFFTTHNFLSFHILKFGLIGTSIILNFYIFSVRLLSPFCSKLNLFLILSLPAIIYMSYFNPIFSFYYSFLLMVNNDAEKNKRVFQS